MSIRKASWVLWAALGGGVISFGAAVGAVRLVAGGALLREPIPVIEVVLPLIAAVFVVLAAAAYFLKVLREPPSNDGDVARLREKLLALDGSSDPDTAARDLVLGLETRFRDGSMIGWALAEAGALLALVCTMLRGPQPVALADLSLWLAFMLFAMPMARRCDDFIGKRLRAAGLGPEQAREVLERAAGRRDR